MFEGRVEYEGVDGKELHGLWDYVWNHGLDEDLDKANEILTAGGVFGV